MPAPTRSQIEATFALPKYKVEIWETSTNSWLTVNASDVIAISGSSESTGNKDNGISFGTSVEQSLTIKIENVPFGTGDTKLISDKTWLLTRMRISFGFDTSDYVTQFVGVIKSRDVSNKDVTFEVVGLLEYVKNTKLYTSIVVQRPFATQTTVSSVENPASGSYIAGAINRILWESGGRPYEQKDITYTELSAGFKFWYSCQQSLIASAYSWVGGENLLEELFTLARAGGGQIYQDASGVVRYVQPLSFGDVSSYLGTYYVFTDAVFDGYSETITTQEAVGKVTTTITGRYIAPVQDIFEDTDPKFFKPAETRTLEFTPDLPIYQYTTVTAVNIHALLTTDVAVTPTIGTVTTSATRITIQITNPSATVPMVIHSIKIQGRPLTAGTDLQFSYGSGEPVKNIENNPYVQTGYHAERLTRMVYDFYSTNRPIITLSNVQYDPDRFIGEIVRVQSQYNRVYAGGGVYNTNFVLYRIIRISHDDIGERMTIDLVDVENLPSRAGMFIIGSTYGDGQGKQLSY